MTRKLLETPQNKVVVASEICPNLSRQSSALQLLKSDSSESLLAGMGRMATPVGGMRVLNQAAIR